jgi:hypothetical protein
MRAVRWMFAAVFIGVAACDAPQAPPPDPTPQAVFAERAAQIAILWHTIRPLWAIYGYISVDDPTIAPTSGFPTEETKDAFQHFRYDGDWTLADKAPGPGHVIFADGTQMKVGVLSPRAAYRDLARMADLGRCGHPGEKPCTFLVVQGATLRTAKIRTTRGVATVPAWAFKFRGVPDPVLRVAVDPQSESTKPQPSAPAVEERRTNLRRASDVLAVDGARIDYRIGGGRCDKGIEPLVFESDEVVVLGGKVTPPSPGSICEDQLVYYPVSVTLGRPLGNRLLVDVVMAQLVLPPRIPPAFAS